jgi:uncharacterized protein RhaS with RHS repeats
VASSRSRQVALARYYDPAAAQWITRDPLAALTQAPYDYVDNNPLTNVDPMGLSTCGEFSLGGIIDCGSKAGPVAWHGGAGLGRHLCEDWVHGGLLGGPCDDLRGSKHQQAPACQNGSNGSTAGTVKPNLEDPTKSPGPGYEWRGNGPKGSNEGSWYNPYTDQSLHPDLGHSQPIGPHYDYQGPDTAGQKVRLYPSDPIPEVPWADPIPPFGFEG